MRRIAQNKGAATATITLFASVVLAVAGPPLAAVWSTNPLGSASGVFRDRNSVYKNRTDGVQCNFDVKGQGVELVTYGTQRGLRFKFGSTSSAWRASGLKPSFLAAVGLYGVNYFGKYVDMAVGTTAQVKVSIQFSQNNVAYDLTYPSIAVMRVSPSLWLFTSDREDIPGNPGFNASDQAAISVLEKRGQRLFGAVHMPIRFEMTSQ